MSFNNECSLRDVIAQVREVSERLEKLRTGLTDMRQKIHETLNKPHAPAHKQTAAHTPVVAEPVHETCTQCKKQTAKRALACGHFMCDGCIRKALRNPRTSTCPVCSAPIGKRQAVKQ